MYFFFIDYTEDQAGQVEKIKARIVEGDHEGPDRTFDGPQAVEQFQAWIRKHQNVKAFSVRPGLSEDRARELFPAECFSSQ